MTLAPDDYREPIITADGRQLSVAVYAVEPVRDVAVLGVVDQGILPAHVTQWALGAATLGMEVDGDIKGGTSGGPVVTSTGRLWGIVSSGARVTQIPRVHLAAPAWLVRQMLPASARKRLDAALPPGVRQRLVVNKAAISPAPTTPGQTIVLTPKPGGGSRVTAASCARGRRGR
jgi:hypothetical protein